jgi:predicted transcriptional regulator
MSATEFSFHQMTSDEMESEIGEYIKRYCINSLQLAQEALAESAGVSVRTLRNLEAGKGTSLRT